MLNKNYILLVILFVLSTSVVFAEPSFYFRKGDTVDIKIPCIYQNTKCSNLTTCNITIIYPNTTAFVHNKQMTNNLEYHNYTLSNSNVIGEYSTVIYCSNLLNNTYTAFTFSISQNGMFNNDWTFILALGIIVFMLCFFAVRLTGDHIFIQILLFVFAFLFGMMIPAFFLMRNVQSIFYKTFMGLIIVLGAYMLIYGSYWLLVKLKLVVPKESKR